ncbi:hypothetical protein BKA93DRAFT_820870 [Sparassis latifolia]
MSISGLVSSSLSRICVSSFDSDTGHGCDASSQTTASMTILQDPSLTVHLLGAILETKSGIASLSRLARTCQALKEPALSLLWRELRGLAPLIALFPNVIQRTLRGRDSIRPKDWSRILSYSTYVRSLVWTSCDAPSYFWSLLESSRGRPDYILPNLTSLEWVDTSAGSLEHCQLFLGPQLEYIALHPGAVANTGLMNNIMQQIATHKHLTTISLNCRTIKPIYFFVHVVSPQDVMWENVIWENVNMDNAPSHGPFIKWIFALPRLKTFIWSEAGSLRSITEELQFIDKSETTTLSCSVLPTRADDDDSHSAGSILPIDSFPQGYHRTSFAQAGLFLSLPPTTEHLDFKTEKIPQVQHTVFNPDGPQKFACLIRLELSAHDLDGLDVFLRQLRNPLRELGLTVLNESFGFSWYYVCIAICEHSGDTLQTLRIRNSIVKAYQTLDLTLLVPLPYLQHLTIDFPHLEPAFEDVDVVDIATTLPSLVELRLSPVVRFPCQSKTRCRLIWDYALWESLEGSVKYEEL